MKVIGAGLPRTATTTQLIAFEQLGFGPCYHMRDLMGTSEARLPLWERVRRRATPTGRRSSATPQSTVRLARRRATTASSLEHYPDAKVVLSVRSAEGWVREHARDDLADVLRRLA